MEVDNSDSAGTSGTSTPMTADASGPSKRLDFLLKQTELFSHFMGSSKSTSPLKMKPVKKKVVKGKDGDNRHRMAEQEEDEELLSDLNSAKKNVVSFDESPAYIKSGKLRDYQVIFKDSTQHQIQLKLKYCR